jgi:hypothetical protein
MTLSVFLFRPLEPDEEVGALSVASKAGWRVYEVARVIQPVKIERTVLPSPLKVNNLRGSRERFCFIKSESAEITNSSEAGLKELGKPVLAHLAESRIKKAHFQLKLRAKATALRGTANSCQVSAVSSASHYVTQGWLPFSGQLSHPRDGRAFS